MDNKDNLVIQTKIKRFISRGLIYLFAILVAVVAFYPFFVMIIQNQYSSRHASEGKFRASDTEYRFVQRNH